MAASPPSSSALIESKADLVAYFESGCKPRAAWRIGTEHEKFVFRRDDLRPLPYAGPVGIGAFLEGLQGLGCWTPVKEDGNIIALSGGGSCAGGSITLEPGGQLELSGAPLATIHETCREVDTHLTHCREIGERLGVGLIGIGFQPKWTRADTPWMPKGRYAIMKRYMPTRGRLGIDMMLRTCTVQTNLDYESEADMVEKFRISLALQPVATALFANSPFTENQPNGFHSYRSHIWTDTDPDRCGILPFVFEAGFGFERYVDYLLDVPMYFVYRNGRYLDAAGLSFRDFLAGRLAILPGEKPTIADFADHATTVFPEVRLKKFIEQRGTDSGQWHNICALPAFWVGLLYDSDCQAEVAALVADMTTAEHVRLRTDVPRLGLNTPFRSSTLRDFAAKIIAIAQRGLNRRARLDGAGTDESGFLMPLRTIIDHNQSPAAVMLKKFHEEWGESVDPLFSEFAY